MTTVGAGRLDKQAQFLAVPSFDPQANVSRGDYAPFGPPVWAWFRPGNPVRMIFGMFRMSMPSGQLVIRADATSRAVTAAMRVELDGQVYQIRVNSLLDRRTGDVVFDLVGAQDASAYAREIDATGEVVTVQRTQSGQPTLSARARAKVDGYQPSELSGGIQQGDRNIVLLAADLDATDFPQPLRTNDRLIVRGRTLNLQAVDDNTHRVGDRLLAYQLQTRG